MTWKLLGWEGQTVLCLLARKFDRAGFIDGVRDAEDVAIMIGSGFPVEVAEAGLRRLLRPDKTGETVFVVTDTGLYWPKFMDAQEASKSDAQRQRELREKRKSEAASRIVTKNAESVTKRDKTSRAVTSCHELSRAVTPTSTVPTSTVPTSTVPTSTKTIDPSLRSGSTQDHVSTSEDFSLSSSITCKHSETKTKTKTKSRTKSKTKTKTDGSKVWESYSSAYEKRYGTLPVRNAKTNSLCARFVELVGADSAPEVAAYYLTSRNAWYVQRGHNLESLVADAGKLHTEWATGNRITQTRAREDDRLQETGDMWQRIIDKYGE